MSNVTGKNELIRKEKGNEEKILIIYDLIKPVKDFYSFIETDLQKKITKKWIKERRSELK